MATAPRLIEEEVLSLAKRVAALSGETERDAVIISLKERLFDLKTGEEGAPVWMNCGRNGARFRKSSRTSQPMGFTMKAGSPSDHFHVIDTSVVVASMEGEPEAERFERVIEMATHRTIAAPSVLEAMMVLTRLRGADSAATVSAELAATTRSKLSRSVE